VAKKQELKALLVSDAKKSTNQKSSKVLEQTIKKSTKRMEDSSMAEERRTIKDEQKQLEKTEEVTETEIERELENPRMVKYEPSDAENKKIDELQQKDKYLISILNVFTTKEEKETTTFNKDDIMQFHITCAVDEIFSQFKADFRIDTIAQDLTNLLPQRLFAFSYNSKLKYPYFEIIFETKAFLEGIFKYQVILTFGHVEYFCVHDSFIYRIV